ncbi:MAG TPA: tryptophan 2,3-dioxygenase family protein [Symbiobacteriaceae bacterium]|nr:tryptophan 2,3-dioxygenase family protein [Symbiobacteriaceae bacterium]
MADRRMEGAVAVQNQGSNASEQTPYDRYISHAGLATGWQPRSGWAGERVLRAGLCAVELTLLLVEQTVTDSRAAARREQRIDRLLEDSRRQLELLDLLLGADGPPAGLGVGQPSQQTALARLAGLPDRHGPAVRKWLATLGELTSRLPYGLGLEAAARQWGPVRSPGQCIPYDDWVEPGRLAELLARRDFNREDALFSADHQVAECWMLLANAELDRALDQLGQGEVETAAATVGRVCSMVSYLTDHLQLLTLMVPADYHRLRVALRGASGAQSKAVYALVARCHRLMDGAASVAQAGAGTWLEVYRAPDQHLSLFALAEALSDLEAGLAEFFFRHYKLAARVLGSAGMGTGGYEVQRLTARFEKPFFPLLDEARIAHTWDTNYRYAESGGSVIAALEGRPAAAEPPPALPGAGVAAETVARFCAALQALEMEAVVALFDEQGQVEDPAGSRPFTGHGDLRSWVTGLRNAFKELRWTHSAVQAGPDGRAETAWETEGTAYNGRPIRFTGHASFAFGPTGLLRCVTFRYDPQAVAAQMHPHPSR